MQANKQNLLITPQPKQTIFQKLSENMYFERQVSCWLVENTSWKIKPWIPSRTSAVPETQIKYTKHNNAVCLILFESLSAFITLLGIAYYQLLLINCFIVILVIARYPFPHHWLIHYFQQNFTDLVFMLMIYIQHIT